jgi:uncharacterized repeat protein (TIGR03943 family)
MPVNSWQAWVKVAILLGLGLYFSYNIISGNLSNYINIRFAWLSYVAASLFLLLGLAGVYRLLRAERRAHEHGISWFALAVTTVPLVLGTAIPSQPLGADAVGTDFNMNALAGENNVSTFTTNPLDRNVLDWIRLFNMSDDITSFNGQEADVTGFVYRDDTFGDDQFLVARFTISCCVADALAVGLPVAWDEDIPNDQWVRVMGTLQVGDFRGERKPILQPTSIELIDQPEHPYLYP